MPAPTLITGFDLQLGIEDAFKKSQREAMPEGALNVEQLKDKDAVVSQVERFERGLINYRERLIKAIQPLANMIVKEVIWDDFFRREMLGSVNEFIRDALVQVEHRLVVLESSLDKMDRELEQYQKNDWDAETEEHDSAQKYAVKLAKSSWLKHTLQRPLVDFSVDYGDAAEAQRDRITAWAKAKLEYSVYSIVRNELQSRLAA